MIRVTKPAKAPAILLNRGKQQRRADSASFTRSRADYEAGLKDFVFKKKIYAHKTVQEALKQAHQHKCFACESKITHISYPNVEHFRPKAAYRQDDGDALHKPGYYWLAYEWSNLFLSCQLCNQQFKKNLFPLANPSARATSHKDDLDSEQPLFIDPSVDDPEQFISFRREVPFAPGDNPKGKATIRGLGLDRQKLNEKRFENYNILRTLYEIARMDPPIPQSTDARSFLARAVEDSAEYAGMARAAIKANFKLV
ncbi:MAG: hypothetical protein QOF61_1689 [Acidobacteriota bacterium]|jgi:uncharacterized protein (TIGR02646 family)|nr:hypothetical protein [Acidobacteriota bacterium]